MWPILFTFENVPLFGLIPVSSFGLFLLLSILVGFFVIWRIIRIYELDPERIIDLTILTILGGLIGSRLLFVILNLDKFSTFQQIVMFPRFPGLSFWGMVLSGLLIIILFAKRFKFNVWKILDVGILGLTIGMSIGAMGCLLGSCQYGLPSTLPFAVVQGGVIEKRFPLQIVESLFYLGLFFYLWKKSFRYNYPGKIASLGFILLGIIKFSLEFFRGDRNTLIGGYPLGYALSVFMIIGGIWIIYKAGSRSFNRDLKFLLNLPVNRNRQQIVVSKTRKNWYNLIVNFRVTFARKRKEIAKWLHIKSNPRQF